MAKIYKTFCLLGIALICVFYTPLANAADPIFTVQDIKVDVTAQNALLAREQAFEQAQVKAFETLAARMLPQADLATFAPPEARQISALIQDFELLNEQLSAVRYVGAYTFRFDDKAVRKYFSASETTFTDVSSRPILVLPFLQRGDNTTIWTPHNTWLKAWNRSPQNHAILPLRLPIGDLSDVQDIKDHEALRYTPAKLASMRQRYTAAEAAIIIAHPDDALFAVKDPAQTAQGMLKVEIYRTDRGEPELVQQITAAANGIQSRSQLYDSAVLRVKAALKDDWKARTMVQTPIQNRLSLRIPIASLPDWLGIQSTLKRVQGITDITVKSMTSTEINADLIFQGNQQRILLALQQNGLSIETAQYPDGQTVNILRQTRYQPARY